jgi:hypothetical protein
LRESGSIVSDNGAQVKAPGRPRVDPDDLSVQVCVTLSSRQYDSYATTARRSDISVPEVIRRRLDAARRRREDEDTDD